MFGYIGSSLINLDKVKSMEKEKERILVRYDDNEWFRYETENPDQDLEEIFQMMKKDSE